ncbi:uncharacterized protein [Amphiura filiformis]|uniref:uncharacterized protein n=1 Tax=Amphiura filiformis TaxID=82378 RepID=UPI003B212C9C
MQETLRLVRKLMELIKMTSAEYDRQSDPAMAAQMHIYDEVPREQEADEEDVPILPPKTTRSSSDKKNNNADSSPVNLALNREEELLLLRKKKYAEILRSQHSRVDKGNRAIHRHESAPARNDFTHIVKRRAETMQDGRPGDPDYQDPDDFRFDNLGFKSNLKTQSSLPCIPAVSTYAEADQVQHQSLGFDCDDEGEYWSIPRDTFSDSGDYAEWPAAIAASHSNYGYKPYAQSTLKKQMSTSTTSSSRTDSSMVDIKTYEDSISSADSPDLPKKHNNRPVAKSRKAFNHYSKFVVHEREVQVNPRDLHNSYADVTTQTMLEVKSCCSCGDMMYISDDTLRLRDLLRFEQSQRLMAEQLFKLAEREVMDLQNDLEEEKKITERLSTDLIKTKDKLKDLDQSGTEYRTKCEDYKAKLNDANDRISKLKEDLAEVNQQKQDVQKMLDTKLAQIKSKNAENNTEIEMLQADLLQSQQEINRLLERLADVNREKSEMVSSEVHTELLRMADERAKRAEMRNMALEHEVRTLRQQYNNSHNEFEIYPMIKVLPDKKDKTMAKSSPTDTMSTHQCYHHEEDLTTHAYKETDPGMLHHQHHHTCFVNTTRWTQRWIDPDRQIVTWQKPPKIKCAVNPNLPKEVLE